MIVVFPDLNDNIWQETKIFSKCINLIYQFSFTFFGHYFCFWGEGVVISWSKSTFIQIIKQQINDHFNRNNKLWKFRVYSFLSF